MLNTVYIILCVVVGCCVKDIGEILISNSTDKSKNQKGGKR